MRLAFLLTNPKHHAEMMQPVAAELRRRGHDTVIVSLAELRGFSTPAGELVAAVPWQLRGSPQVGASFGADGAGPKGALRKAAQRALLVPLLPRLAWLLRGADAVVVPNDAAYPYRELVEALRLWRKPVALLQEGIRFPLPAERGRGSVYGASGVAAVCAWGDGAAEHLRAVASRGTRVVVTGNPRLDDLDIPTWRARGHALMRQLHLGDGPFLYMSNPVDDQGFCSTADKLALFERFVELAAEELVRRAAPLVVKLHPREDVAAFQRLAARAPIPVHVDRGEPLFAWLAVARGAVVLASTVGLEALRFGVPLGVLPLPGHGHVFEYASRGAAVPLSLAHLERDVAQLFDDAATRAEAAAALVTRHLGASGGAAARIADVLEALARR
ncbi:MAG: hypothetical protein R3B48_26520 [Kofleriaceae bacterium]